MDARRQALLLDFGLAVGSMVLGGLATTGANAASLLIAVVGVVGITVVLWLSEHTAVLSLLDDRRPLSFVLVALGLLAVLLVVILGRLVVPTPSGPLLLGMGIGLAAYRTVYGLVRPLPAARTAHRQLGGEWD